ncbi:50S ribosomal protein L22 [Candidatus Marinamargulisbacteria bacterium SCGC AG-410-N11]|nr:50S ribosomal protein L22 [Candidatus Marinamargulisbacteria bacterium SCGC AG-410-N11]
MESNLVKSRIKYLRVSPFKVRRIVRQLDFKNPQNVISVLDNMTGNAADVLGKAVKSAISNAVNNNKFDFNSLFFKEITVDEGTKIKRHRPRARGRMFSIKKPMCHIRVIVAVKEGAVDGTKK